MRMDGLAEEGLSKMSKIAVRVPYRRGYERTRPHVTLEEGGDKEAGDLPASSLV